MRFALALTLVCKVALGAANPVAFAEALALEHGSAEANSMGEIAMLYPTDREWSEEAETVAPCGSYASISNRSEFPLDDGFVALVAKTHKAWSVDLKISYNSNPTSNDDFDTWASRNVTNQIDIGHTCFYLPDPPSTINEGDYATIQLEYMALEDEANVTHYACADIQFVEKSVFDVTEYSHYCFNATDNDYYSSEITVDTSSWYASVSSADAASSAAQNSGSSSATTSATSSTATSTATATTTSSSSKGLAGRAEVPGALGMLLGLWAFSLF
ncbi:hypothetical protein OGAPHI_001544 [Ogataea philodendri]|uniref:Copper acquisition factor BIM1-like domain-containing protein n=1 Tax=Ogataea philodendri TaxID=1378263 RepID=A0A9P8T7P7_9ASCO|nr:uncharacterized protein OGAPHI_001544 [Ogataea philodendri]KAH3669423.1 hypothetical protein OGAPHI_001544 [Ogataea philodendri]